MRSQTNYRFDPKPSPSDKLQITTATKRLNKTHENSCFTYQ